MLKSLSSVFSEVGKGMPVLEECFLEQKLNHLWYEVIPPQLARSGAECFLKGDQVTVYVAEVSWIQEISSRKSEILKVINQRFSAERPIRSMRVFFKPREKERGESPLPEIVFPHSKGDLQGVLKRDTFLKNWRRTHGWRNCPQCGILHQDKKRCKGCSQAEHQAFLKQVEQMLCAHPWLSFQDVLRDFPTLLPEQFEEVYRRVESGLKEELFRLVRGLSFSYGSATLLEQRFWKKGLCLVALWTGKSPVDLERKQAEETLSQRFPQILRKFRYAGKKEK